jgi:hypothetical protein
VIALVLFLAVCLALAWLMVGAIRLAVLGSLWIARQLHERVVRSEGGDDGQAHLHRRAENGGTRAL